MNKKIKELIESAPISREGTFNNFLIIPSGEKYNGVWGKNGYNNIILLGKKLTDAKWYNITESADSVMFSKIRNVNFDIPSDTNCVRFWFDEPIRIDNRLNLSTLIGYPMQEESDE